MNPRRYMSIFCEFVLLVLLLQLASCKKFLDAKSNDSLTVPTSIEDLQGLLDDAVIMNNGTTPSLVETSADDYFLIQSTYNSRQPRDQQAYTWRLGDYNFQNDWSIAYSAVYNANLCLETIEKVQRIPTNESKWKNVKGAALFYRAYYFLWLVWEHGKAFDINTSNSDPGIVLRTSSDFNIPSVQASVMASYDKVLSDAKESLSYLPDMPTNAMRPSKAAAYGLLARAYLSMRQYDSALKYSDFCLQIKDDLFNFNTDFAASGTNITGNIPFVPFNKEIIFYTETGTTFALHIPSRGRIDTTLYASYSANDLRRMAFFRPNGIYRRFKGSYAASDITLFSGIATDEIYLIRAECYARAGNGGAGDLGMALIEINKLLENRINSSSFVPATAATQQEFLDIVLSERRKELLMRGLRWMDIKRLNKENANITLVRKLVDGDFSLASNSDYYALPIPKDVFVK